MYFGYFYFDPWYIPVLLAMLFSLIASARVSSAFKKYSQTRTLRGMTGADAARAVLRRNGITDVRVEPIAGKLTDHFDPKTKVIRLSENVFAESTPAAVGVAAHEAGHAVQYANDYAPMKLRAAIIPATNIGSKLSVPLVFIGVIFMSIESFAGISDFFYYVAWTGILCFGMCVLFQLVTLPVEFNASRRALSAIQESELLTNEERKGARRVLSAAAMTYVAALSVTLMQFLRLVAIVGRRRD